jgi:hypothetical protein
MCQTGPADLPENRQDTREVGLTIESLRSKYLLYQNRYGDAALAGLTKNCHVAQRPLLPARTQAAGLK